MSINIKKFLKVLPHSFTFFFAVVLTVFFQEPIKHCINRYYSKAELSYEVMSISKLSRHEIQKYEKAEKFDSFNLNLDDSILNNYYIIKLRIKNEGIPIKRNLKIQAAIDKTAAKFLDIKHKVHFPNNKIIPIMYTIPELTWSMKESAIPFQKPALKWNAPKLNADGSRIVFGVKGYNIYRSRLKEVGYGRINPNLIKDTYYIDHSPELNNTAFYCVEAVKKAGFASKLSDPVSISFPEMSAFKPYFENAVLIDPSKKVKVPNASFGKPIYGSLSEAVEQEIDASVFIINKNKKEVKDVDKYTGNINEGVKIFYRDDLNFLNGKTDILLTSGLDADADIIFYFLVKIYPEVAFDFNLMLEGPPDVSFIKQTAQNRNNLFNKTENTSPQIDKKKSFNNS